MFEVGTTYNFVTISVEDDSGPYDSSEKWTVTAVEGNLLHLHVPAREGVTVIQIVNDAGAVENELPGVDTPERNMVLNTASAFFHSATPVADE